MTKDTQALVIEQKSNGDPIRAFNDAFEIVVDSIKQAGDVFLLIFKCPKCKETQFCSYPPEKCSWCDLGYIESPVVLPKNKNRFELLVGSKRKQKNQISKAVIRLILEDQKSLCAYCESLLGFDAFHIDHIIPISVGGTNGRHNLALSCKKCNGLAGSKAFRNLTAKKLFILSKRI